MTDRTLTLPEDLVAEVEERVASGAAASAADVVRAGLAALESEDARRLEALREKIGRSLADPRPSIPMDVAFKDIHALLDALGRK